MNKQHPTKPRPAPTIVWAVFTVALYALAFAADRNGAPMWQPPFLVVLGAGTAVLTGVSFAVYLRTRRPYVRRLRARERGDAPWQNRGY